MLKLPNVFVHHIVGTLRRRSPVVSIYDLFHSYRCIKPHHYLFCEWLYLDKQFHCLKWIFLLLQSLMYTLPTKFTNQPPYHAVSPSRILDRYMSHWYGRPRKHRYNRWNRVVIKCGNGDNRFAVSTSGLRPPSWICHFRSFEKVFRRTLLSSRSVNLIKMSHDWYETHA